MLSEYNYDGYMYKSIEYNPHRVEKNIFCIFNHENQAL